MLPQPRDPGRHSLPHFAPLTPPNQSVIVFLTVCVSRRRPLLAQPDVASLLVDAWQKADRWKVGRYVIMPDHVHLFCAPGTFPPSSLKSWILFWRAFVTRAWPRPDEKPVWQRDFFDRQLRHGESYHEKWLYVWQNPVRAGLVGKAEDWPHQGELNVLQWHDRA